MSDTFRENTGGPSHPSPHMDRAERVGLVAGVLAPLVLLVTVLGGALATPSYQWPTDPFSVVGGTDGVVALAFNAGLVLAGGLAVLFAVPLWRHWRPVLGVLYAVGGVGLVGAGLFPAGSGLHAIAALFFVTAWIPPVVAGIADWRAGRQTLGAVAAALGLVALGIWLPYDLGLSWAMVGYGAAELVTFITWGAWSAWTASRLGNRSTADGTPRTGVAT